VQVWQQHVQSLTRLLDGLSFTYRDGAPVEQDAGFAERVDVTLRVRERRHTVSMIGNGASASMASHFAADLAKNGRLHTQVFSDLSLITAISNDMGYEHVFAEPLRKRGDLNLYVAATTYGLAETAHAAALHWWMDLIQLQDGELP